MTDEEVLKRSKKIPMARAWDELSKEQRNYLLKTWRPQPAMLPFIPIMDVAESISGLKYNQPNAKTVYAILETLKKYDPNYERAIAIQREKFNKLIGERLKKAMQAMREQMAAQLYAPNPLMKKLKK